MKGFSRITDLGTGINPHPDGMVYISSDRSYLLRFDESSRGWKVSAVGRPGKIFKGWMSLPDARAAIADDRARMSEAHALALELNA